MLLYLLVFWQTKPLLQFSFNCCEGLFWWVKNNVMYFASVLSRENANDKDKFCLLLCDILCWIRLQLGQTIAPDQMDKTPVIGELPCKQWWLVHQASYHIGVTNLVVDKHTQLFFLSQKQDFMAQRFFVSTTISEQQSICTWLQLIVSQPEVKSATRFTFLVGE